MVKPLLASRLFQVFFLAVVAAPWSATAAPSINCNAPQNDAERTVCEDVALKALSTELDELVDKVRASTAGRRQAQQQFEKQQEQWPRQVRDRCQKNVTCLTNSYQQRINQARSAAKLPAKAWPKPQEKSVAVIDCKAPQTESAVTICNDAALVELDAEIVSFVEQVIAQKGGGPQAVRGETQQHNARIKGIHDKCKDNANCLTDSYQRMLNGWLAHFGKEERKWPKREDKAGVQLVKRPALLPPSRRDGDPFTLQGLWEGSYTCHQEALLVTMEGGTAGESGVLRLEYYPAAGKEGAIGARQYNFKLETILGEVTLRPGRLIGSQQTPRAQDAELSGFIGADGNSVKGVVRHAARQCGEFSFMKVEKSTQRDVALAAVALPPQVKPAVTMLAAKTYQEFCTALRTWGDQYIRAHPEVRTAEGFSAADRIQQENLLRDDLFEPYVGKKASEITRDDFLHLLNKWQEVPPWDRTGRKSCDATGEQFAQSYFRFFQGAAQSSFKAYGEQIRQALVARDRLIEGVAAVPVDRRSVERLNALLNESKERLTALWPTDRKAFEDTVSRKKEQIAGLALTAKMQEAGSGPATLEVISDLHYLRKNAQGDEEARAKAVIGGKLSEYAATEMATLPQQVDDLAKLVIVATKQSDLRKKFEPYGEYDATLAALASIATRLKQDADNVGPKIKAELAGQASPAGFFPYLAQLRELDRSGGDRVAIAPLWELYLAAVDAWVAGQIASAKAVASGTSKPPTGFDPNNPLGASTDTKFDPANPLGQRVGSSVPSAAEEEFLNRPWKLREFIRAAFLNDTPTLYEMGVVSVVPASKALGGKIGVFCPGAMPLDLEKIAIDQELGYDIFNPDLKSVMESAAKSYERVFRMGTNMGQTMQDLFKDEEADRMMNADAQLMVAEGCQDARIARIFANLLAFARDPTAGVPSEKVTLLDICLKDKVSRPPVPGPREKKYCACAAPILGAELTDTQKQFVRLDIANNFHIVRALFPRVFDSLGQCITR